MVNGRCPAPLQGTKTMTTMTSTRTGDVELKVAESVEEAVSLLAETSGAAPLGGATWVMGRLWRGDQPVRYVHVGSIREMRRIDGDSIGASVTHDELAARPGALGEAARLSAFPAVRAIATLAGNICADPFPEADLVPALLALDARLEIHHREGREEVGIAAYLATRAERPRQELLVRVHLQEHRQPSAFERLTIRGGAEYAVVNVAVAVEVEGNLVRSARIAIGGVEDVARRCVEAEASIVGYPIDSATGEAAGESAASELRPREAGDVPGWYRIAVLPALLGRAFSRISANDKG